ncbi:MAG: Gfo/Idh/MocA family protein [Streptosporangiaceae bacterium]
MRHVRQPARAAFIGCGMIAGEYAATLAASSEVNLVACADANRDTALSFARQHHIPRVANFDDLLDPATTDIAVVLTPPATHAPIAHAAIRASIPGVYVEKPLAASPSQARAITQAAAKAGVLLGAAPDTILGAPTQTARAAIEAGVLGNIVAASASYFTPGPERWHPRPEPFHAAEAGPLADMGPYYLTSLTYLLGHVECVIGAFTDSQPHRVIRTGPRAGQTFTASAPTNVTALLRTANATTITFATSFDSAGTHSPHLEIHGSKATITLPDPNFHEGEVQIRMTGDRHWQLVRPAAPAITPVGRGMGIVALADALQGRQSAFACTGGSAAHITSVIGTIYRAAAAAPTTAVHVS